MKTCSIKDCDRKFQAKGFCKKHYLHFWRFGTPLPHVENHRMHSTRLYNIWSAMKQRYYYEKSIRYEHHGRRGIEICPEWRNSFVAFHQWALANGYEDSLSIDRKDNDGNYEPGNCKWSTHKEQANNKAINHFVTIGNSTRTLAQWAEEVDMNYFTLKTRVRRGWTAEKAILTPVGDAR